jgi:SAM-dependent methyltransferase
VARVRAEKLRPFIGPQAAVFEYGVGYGWNLAELRCRRRIGYDVGEFLEPAARAHGIEFVHDSGVAPDQSCDVVICHHVLEHVLNPADSLAECHRILRPDGVLLLFVPYEKERRFRRFNRQERNGHLYSWNVQTLSALTEQSGFFVVDGRVAMFSYDRFSSVWAVRLGLGERGYRFIRRAAHCLYPCLETRVVARRVGC